MINFGDDAIIVDYTYEFTESELDDILCELGAAYTRLQGENIQSDHCFFHNNSSPTLGVSLESPHAWNCFVPSCQSKGSSIVSLVKKALGMESIDEAHAWLMSRYPHAAIKNKAIFEMDEVEAKYHRFELSEAALQAYPLEDNNRIGFRAIAYMRNKHGDVLCTEEEAIEYELGYNHLDHHLVFPVRHSDGTLAGLIGRVMRGKPRNRYINYDGDHFKKARCLMGAHLPIDRSQPIIVVEGPTDYVYLRSCGLANVRATMGADISEQQVEMIVGYDRPVVPLFDMDSAGDEGRRKLKKYSGDRIKFRPFLYPKGSGKDPREIPRSMIDDLVKSFRSPSFI